MKKHFYGDIVEIESVYIELNGLSLTEDEKEELLSLAKSHLHNEILDIVLSNLSGEDKKLFLMNLHENNHNKTWLHLKEKIADVQDLIKETSEKIKADLIKDIKDRNK